MDQTATLSEPERASLDAKLAAFEQAAGPQIVIFMVATTQPEDMTFAQRVGEAWKIGRRGWRWTADRGARMTARCASKWRRHWKVRCPTWPRGKSSRTPSPRPSKRAITPAG
ncbi:TPM domain-containing protein [Roseateles sp. GG27B]